MGWIPVELRLNAQREGWTACYAFQPGEPPASNMPGHKWSWRNFSITIGGAGETRSAIVDFHTEGGFFYCYCHPSTRSYYGGDPQILKQALENLIGLPDDVAAILRRCGEEVQAGKLTQEDVA
jgi:hypothetical protein